MNFTIQNAGQQITASASAGAPAAAIDLSPQLGAQRSDVMIYNPGPGLVHVRAGAADVTATADCMPILAGEKGAWDKGAATHLAAYSPDGAQTLWVFVGAGSDDMPLRVPAGPARGRLRGVAGAGGSAPAPLPLWQRLTAIWQSLTSLWS